MSSLGDSEQCSVLLIEETRKWVAEEVMVKCVCVCACTHTHQTRECVGVCIYAYESVYF